MKCKSQVKVGGGDGDGLFLLWWWSELEQIECQTEAMTKLSLCFCALDFRQNVVASFYCQKNIQLRLCWYQNKQNAQRVANHFVPKAASGSMNVYTRIAKRRKKLPKRSKHRTKLEMGSCSVCVVRRLICAVVLISLRSLSLYPNAIKCEQNIPHSRGYLTCTIVRRLACFR